MNHFDLKVLSSIKKIVLKHRIMIILMMVVLGFSKISIMIGETRAERIIAEQRREVLAIKDGYSIDAVMSLPEKRMKVAAHTTLIIKRYSYKYHKKKPKGMKPLEIEQVVRYNIKFSEALNNGYYDIISLGLLESEFNPYARGELQDEASWLQMARSAVDEARGYWHQLPASLKPMLDFKYDSENHFEVLLDPVNALKVAHVRWWGLKRDYKNQMMWVSIIWHWGKGIHRYYRLGELPEFFTFTSRKTKEKYKRSCRIYFDKWYAIKEAFTRGVADVQKELDYWKDVRNKMVISELQLIDSYKVIKKLKYLLEEASDIQTSYHDGMNDYYKKIRKEVKKTDKQYKWVFKGIKEGHFGKAKTAAKFMKHSDKIFKEFRDRVYKKDQWQFWTLFGIMGGILLSLTTILVFVVLNFVNKYKKNK